MRGSVPSTPTASSSPAGTRRGSRDGARVTSPCRIRHPPSWSTCWRRRPAIGCSMPVPLPEGRRRSSRAGSERKDGSSPGISGRNARRWSVSLLHRLGQRAALLAHDATRPAVRGPFDRVLVDAPCTGIGSARRRPELLWRGRRDELSRLARLQVAIAAAGADLLRPGGRLVYSVCTFPRAETDAACDAILRHRPDLEPVSTPGPAGADPATRHRLWPHRHGTDGMFVAAFERTG